MIKKIPIIIILLLSGMAHAQIGNLLKKEAVKFVKKEGTNLLKKELNKTKAKFDSTSFSYAVSLNDKAAQFESQDKLADVVAVSSLVVTEAKDETPLGEARNYMDIGEMSYSANGFKLAEGSFLSATAILYAHGLQAHPLYGRGLANLGLLYNSMGRYSASMEFTDKALEVRKEHFGTDSKDYAASLNNLAVLNKDLGHYNDAEKQLSEAIALNRQVAGDEDIAYAISLNNRGVLYQTLGRYDDAEQDMKQALEVAAKTLNTNSLQYTRLQSNLALLYQQQGRFADAEEIYLKAINSIARNPTKNKKTNPDYAHMLENLASLYVKMEQYDKAEDLYVEALAVYEKKFDNKYSGFGLTSARLGALFLVRQNLSEAEKYLLEAEEVIADTYGIDHPYSVDLQVQLGHLFWLKGDNEQANNYFVTALDKSMDFVGEYFAPMSDTEKALYWKTLRPRFEGYYAFAASNDDKEVLAQAMNYRIVTKAMLLSGATKVKNQILNSGDEELIKDYNTWLDQKGTLAHYYSMSEEDIREQGINLDSIDRAANVLEKSLSERSGIFTEAYQSTNPTLQDVQTHLKDGQTAVEIIRIGKTFHSPLSYMAVVIYPDEIKKVVFENGIELEDKSYKLYRNLVKFKREDNLSYANFWQPIDELLGNSSKSFLSLDGVYNQLSINSLSIDQSTFVGDKRSYTIIPSLREVSGASINQQVKVKKAVLYGNPDYQSTKIDPLPGTGDEVAAISQLLKTSGYSTVIKTGEGASEENFVEQSKVGIVHVATHGFFVADPNNEQTSVFSIPLYNVNENVLLRSGLLFAGAGNTSGEKLAGTANGVLTSYDVINLDMANSDIVILSACETGLGDVMAGEGVFGLQRAFQIAGAKAVIMSLWKVDDKATKQLMVSFYKNWLLSGNLDQAFSKAQNEVRRQYSHPYYWGSFVLLRN